MSFQTELEQGRHRVLLPSPPFLLEFTYNVCLSGELKAEPYIVPFAFFKTLAIPLSPSKYFFVCVYYVLGLGTLLELHLFLFHWTQRACVITTIVLIFQLVKLRPRKVN